MKRRITALQIIYLVTAVLLVSTMTYTQTRGLRLLNLFSIGLITHPGPGGPVHK
jgi:hypothetical protein